MNDFDIIVMSQRIKELRNAKGILQKDLGKHLGIAQNTIAGYETAKACPSLDILVKLANFFDTTTDYILGRVDFE